MDVPGLPEVAGPWGAKKSLQKQSIPLLISMTTSRHPWASVLGMCSQH